MDNEAPRRKPITFNAPPPIDSALRRRAAHSDLAVSRLVLRYVREGLQRDGVLGEERA